ncbi:hypothetical protein [Rivularia sp. UHCC 0363]|uniref:hypothetical protein n=1 Tax=Rivularia sp. UHCC 0363 TaxID=3110244 RepID=UPI002B216F4D|nr:hypothetical protein [Rivularia sp. UHCC 0363]MEA5598490.1 hypothetical protein [Rivularia sp. UHCC 0363]
MAFNNPNETNGSIWNPFQPTKRDIDRTEQLAKKNPVIAGLLTFFFLPAAMLYLNRGVNNLKILGYVFVLAFAIAIVSEVSENKSDKQPQIIGLLGNIAIIAENIRTITLARKRQSEINF